MVVVSIFFNISIVFEILNMLKISKFNCIIGFDNQYFNRNLGIILNHREFIDCTGPLNYMKTLRSGLLKMSYYSFRFLKNVHSWKKWNRTKQLKFLNNYVPQNLIMVRYR